MSLADRERAELFEALTPTLGREVAVKLVDALPPAGEALATAHQVDALERRMDDRFAAVEQRMDDRFAAFEQRMEDGFATVRAEMGTVRAEMGTLRAQMEAQGADLLAAFRGELVTAVSGQTRAVTIATATAVFGIGGLAVTLAQVL